MYEHRFEKKAGEWFAPPIDPADELDYQLIFDKLLIDDDEVDTVTWSVLPDTLTIVTAKNSNTENTATVWLTGAQLGELYTVKAQVSTTAGREFSRSFKILCRKR